MPTSRSAKSGPSADSEKADGFSRLETDVRAVLAEFPTATAPPRFEPVSGHGGLSGAKIWRVHAGSASFSLRQWPAEHPSPERLRFIHAVLEHAYSHAFHKVPLPLRTRNGESFVEQSGRLWELAPWLPGEVSYGREPNRAKIAAAMEILAKFHLASASFGETRPHESSQGLTERGRRLEELNGDAIRTLGQAIETYRINPPIDELARSIHGCLSASIPAVRPMLQAAIPLQLPLQPCLRDIWHGNLLFTGDKVTGIVDFGAMQVDSPALDVARLLGSMAADGPDSWQAGLAAYEAFRPLSTYERVAVRAADASGVVLGCVNWLRWLYVERREFGDLAAVERRMKFLLPRLQNLVARLSSGR